MIRNTDSSSPPWDWPYYAYESPLERWIKFDRHTGKDDTLKFANYALGILAGLLLLFCLMGGSRTPVTSWLVAFLLAAAALGLYLLRKRMDDYAYLDCDTRCIYTVSSYGFGTLYRQFCTFDEVHCLAVKPAATSSFDSEGGEDVSLSDYELHWSFALSFITKDGRELVVSAWPEMHEVSHGSGIYSAAPAEESLAERLLSPESFGYDPGPIGEEVADLCGFEFVPAPSRKVLEVEYSEAEGVQLKHVDPSGTEAVKALVFSYFAGPIALVGFVLVCGFLFLLTRFM